MIDKNDLLFDELGDIGMGGKAIELPFPVVYFWAINGQSALKAQGGAQYYGGWSSKADQVDLAIADTNRKKPAHWLEAFVAPKDGDEYAAYTARSLVFAPIYARTRWLGEGGKYKLHFDQATGCIRQHIQMLVMMSDVNPETNRPVVWGPGVLSAKGYQAKYFGNAIAQWNKATQKLRSVISPNAPPNIFWCAVGTFGKERRTQEVGKAGRTSFITPLTLYVPDNLDEKYLESLYVGKETAAAMRDYKAQADQWLHAWEKELDNSGGAVVVNGPPEPEDVSLHDNDGDGGNPWPF